MTNKTWLLALLLGFATAMFTACNEDDDTSSTPGPIVTDVTIDGTAYKKVEGDIEQDFTFDSGNNWLLSGGVFVTEGYTLTVEEGTTVYAADDNTTPFLSVERGAKIMAEGTASAPIVFTSIKDLDGTADRGDWGGIIVNGYADINTGETAEGEGGSGTYGGTDDADNSGTLRYVRVEYAGKSLGENNELNGFSFNGVGSGTTVEYIQAYRGDDDGIEFFGGTVNVKYAVSVGNSDDSFDWTDGWRGNGQFWVVLQESSKGDRGIEADNSEDNNAATPFSNPTVSNVTLVGADDGDGDNQGIKFRQGVKGKYYNFIVADFPKRGVQVEHNQTLANMNDGSLVFKNSIVDGANPFVGTTSPTIDPVTGEEIDGTTVATTFETDPSNRTIGAGLIGIVGSVSDGAYDPTNLGTWFSAASYIGAVPTGQNWTSGWTRGL